MKKKTFLYKRTADENKTSIFLNRTGSNLKKNQTFNYLFYKSIILGRKQKLTYAIKSKQCFVAITEKIIFTGKNMQQTKISKHFL